MIPPLARRRSLPACSRGHAVVVCKIRYVNRGSQRPVRETARRPRVNPGTAPKGCQGTRPVVVLRTRRPLSYIPSDGLLVGCTPGSVRGPLFIFRKIHLYGKTKKSTHGHQTVKPSCTNFVESCSNERARRGESNGTPHASPGPLVGAQERSGAGGLG